MGKQIQKDLTDRWMAEKQSSDGSIALQEQIASVKFEIEKAEREYDLEKAAELKYGTLPELEARLEAAKPLEEERAQNAAEGAAEEDKLLRDEVVAEDIADIISVWTGIPASKMMDSEKNKVLAMGSKLKERVVGQDEAVDTVTLSIQRSRAGLNDPSKPIASMVFLGPTGVGKTELAKALATFLFDAEDSLIRIDMSEYMEKHTVSRLLGAPPGYVGDDGRVTDSKGRVVDFKNCVIIFTTNIGSQDIIDLGGEDEELMKSRVFKAMKDNFKPEFLNRIDDNVIFNSLSKDDLRGIVILEVKKLEQRLAERDISMIITPLALDTMADIGFDPVYGARPLKRAIQRELETAMAKGILRGDFAEGDEVTIDAPDGHIAIWKSGASQAMAETVLE